MAQTLKLNTMKKKLQLNKEIVSILDRNSMRQMTKAGGNTTIYDPTNRCESAKCVILTEKLCIASKEPVCASVDHDVCVGSLDENCPTVLETACDCPTQTQEENGCVVLETHGADCDTQFCGTGSMLYTCSC